MTILHAQSMVGGDYSHRCVSTLQTMHILLSHGAPQETAEYAIQIAIGKGEMDLECSDPTYIIVGWCAMSKHNTVMLQ